MSEDGEAMPLGGTEEDQVRWLLDDQGVLSRDDGERVFATLDESRRLLTETRDALSREQDASGVWERAADTARAELAQARAEVERLTRELAEVTRERGTFHAIITENDE